MLGFFKKKILTFDNYRNIIILEQHGRWCKDVYNEQGRNI